MKMAAVKKRFQKHRTLLLRQVFGAFTGRLKWVRTVRKLVAEQWNEYAYNLRAGPFRRWFLYAHG